MNHKAHSSEKAYHLPKFTNAFFAYFPFAWMVFIGFGLLTFLPFFNDSFADSIGTTLAGIAFLIAMMYIYTAIKRSRLVSQMMELPPMHGDFVFTRPGRTL